MMRFVYMALGMLICAVTFAACGVEQEPAFTPAPTPTLAPALAPDAEQDAQSEEHPGNAPASTGDVANGQTLFSTSCSACHGPAGEGVPGLGKDMTESEFIAGLSDEELIAFIQEGRPAGDPLNTTGIAMPPNGGNPALNDEELLDIVAFMRSIHVN